MKSKICLSVMLFATLAMRDGLLLGDETPRVFPHPERIRYDRQCLTIDGQDVFVFSGAFHYFRCPKALWADRFQKIKAAGFNCVETYVPWNWHERRMPARLQDASKVDLTDLEDFLTLAENFGLYVIIRPGPYICAEWDTGGFPQWLMTKKPAQPLRKELWLRTDDPVYLAWCRHWYDAVCPVIARHQVTHQPPGRPGVILFQIENEYDFVKPKLSDEIMRNQLRALVQAARTNGIDVPLFTCLTRTVRGVEDPLLRQVFDVCNFYPLWKVDEIQEKIDRLHREQPDAPLATAELQGGWFAKVGGKLSEDQEGLTAAQINNLTLFALQNGETILNYYMLFGGTNPGDWAARGMISSYDYNAPIRECGGIGERYQRVRALGLMLREHGPRLLRAVTVAAKTSTAQKDVTVVERRGVEGGRYFFVRTSQHEESRIGEASVEEQDGRTPAVRFAYDLEPFGAKVLYLPSGVNDPAQGEWLPKAAPAIARPTSLPPAITVGTGRWKSDPGPAHWIKLARGENLAQVGIDDSRFLFYKTKASCRTEMKLAFSVPSSDAILADINDQPVARIDGNTAFSVFRLTAGKSQVRLLYENGGHDNGLVKMEHPRGVLAAHLFGFEANDPAANAAAGLAATNSVWHFPEGTSQTLWLGEPEGVEREWWRPGFNDKKWRTAAIGTGNRDTNVPAQLVWYRMSFELPKPVSGTWVPWHLRLAASGNGFLYLNGHALGRYWQAGPQREFFLPECWLEFGPGKKNILTLSLRPVDRGVAVNAAVVEPYADLAEYR